jgi:hypothetical protein
VCCSPPVIEGPEIAEQLLPLPPLALLSTSGPTKLILGQGPFYPPTKDNSAWLKYYSQVFDYVEIDSSFYRIPTLFMAKNWYKRSPQNFKFTAKFPKIITHDKKLKDVDKELERFLEAMRPLADKTNGSTNTIASIFAYIRRLRKA